MASLYGANKRKADDDAGAGPAVIRPEDCNRYVRYDGGAVPLYRSERCLFKFLVLLEYKYSPPTLTLCNIYIFFLSPSCVTFLFTFSGVTPGDENARRVKRR